ncbi:MAG: polyphosphate polymerase domain-containing protein [Candidatus Cloacimonetes bacterium]|nr:polyphosphate polymerase domain-containing protein [Candidatus Cloacimonadota bacterium]
MSKKELNFKRKEKKYLILEHSFDQIKEELEQHIPVQIFQGENCISGIETTYMDTKDFLLFREYLCRRDFRFKIRLRRYKNDGVFDECYLVELKVKWDKMSLKRRFTLPARLLPAFLKGENLKKEIKEANQGFSGAQKTYKIIAQLIELNHFVPVLRSSYQRIAFQKKTKHVRVTVDQRVTHEKLLGKPETATLDAVILESKISGKSPKWHKKMVNKLSLLRQDRFSKFATGINSLYFPQRGKYNFNADNEADYPMPDNLLKSIELINKVIKIKEEPKQE